MRELAASAGVDLAERPALPFWDAIGGKLALAGITAGLFVFFAWGRRPEEAGSSPEEE